MLCFDKILKHIIASVLVLMFSNLVQAGTLDDYLQKYSKITPVQRYRVSLYDELIVYFSQHSFFQEDHAVDPDFLRSLILSESNAKCAALSPKDAMGLTQMRYQTAKEASEQLLKYNKKYRYVDTKRLEKLEPQDLYDPAINLLLASFIISKYNKRYNGRLDLVVAAWNAGPSTIKDDMPPAYPETLALIGRVNGYMMQYKGLM